MLINVLSLGMRTSRQQYKPNSGCYEKTGNSSVLRGKS